MVASSRLPAALRGYGLALLAVVGSTGIGEVLVHHFALSEVIMGYLLGIIVVSMYSSRGPALFASVLSVATFDFCFVPPYYTFRVTDTRFIFTFAVMVITGLVISGLSRQVKRQADRALRAEKEALRTALLSSISHDLRTPLCAITGAASTLLDEEHPIPRSAQRELLTTIYDESDHLNQLVRNLLDMTRLEAGGLLIKKEWTPLEEVVGSALDRLEKHLVGHPVRVALPSDLPMLSIDGILIEQLFYNLLENATKHTPSGTTIEIAARATPKAITVEVSDNGPGLLPGSEARVFEKFFRGPRSARDGGVGLGLAICRGIVEAHDGTILARNRPGGGTVFEFVLPITGRPPALPTDAKTEAEHG